MRVFCPEHKRGFFAPRQNPIKCENRGHLLGEIDFEGQSKSPVEIQWQYCCNCEHFSLLQFDDSGAHRCPVCTRRSSLLYLCDGCYIISCESNTPLQVKNFTLTPEGAPQPSCPGCLRPASADLHEHTCDELNASFVTGLSACPICEERLDIAPAFPSLVAPYLKLLQDHRAENEARVTGETHAGDACLEVVDRLPHEPGGQHSEQGREEDRERAEGERHLVAPQIRKQVTEDLNGDLPGAVRVPAGLRGAGFHQDQDAAARLTRLDGFAAARLL